MAHRLSGRFQLRIEDIDPGRSREEFVSAIFEDLKWLGLSWPQPVLRQRDRFQAYAKATQTLDELGVLYPCFATRAQISRAIDAAPSSHKKTARDPDGAHVYPGLYRDLPPGEAQKMKRDGQPFALRLNMQKALDLAHDRLGQVRLTFKEHDENGFPQLIDAHPQRWGDAVIVRKDTPASYHLAVVVDDAYENISHVTRGRDLYAATDIHRLLQVLLDLPQPSYHHHRLIEDDNHLKLSKSDRATSLRSLRANGWTPRDVKAHLGLDADIVG